MDRSKVGVLDPAGVLQRRGPWTVDDWRELDLGPSVHWRQVELEHGTLVVSPTPEWQHDAAGSGPLAALLPQLPKGLRVVVPAELALSRTWPAHPTSWSYATPRRRTAARSCSPGTSCWPWRSTRQPADAATAWTSTRSTPRPASRRTGAWSTGCRGSLPTRCGGDRYVEVASVVGDEPLELAAPFPLRVVPAELLGPPTG